MNWTVDLVQEVAARAQCDWRTAAKGVFGHFIRGKVGERVTKAIADVTKEWEAKNSGK